MFYAKKGYIFLLFGPQRVFLEIGKNMFSTIYFTLTELSQSSWKQKS